MFQIYRFQHHRIPLTHSFQFPVIRPVLVTGQTKGVITSGLVFPNRQRLTGNPCLCLLFTSVSWSMRHHLRGTNQKTDGLVTDWKGRQSLDIRLRHQLEWPITRHIVMEIALRLAFQENCSLVRGKSSIPFTCRYVVIIGLSFCFSSHNNGQITWLFFTMQCLVYHISVHSE